MGMHHKVKLYITFNFVKIMFCGSDDVMYTLLSALS